MLYLILFVLSLLLMFNHSLLEQFGQDTVKKCEVTTKQNAVHQLIIFPSAMLVSH